MRITDGDTNTTYYGMNLEYINSEQHEVLEEKCDEVGRILQGLIRSLNEKMKLTESV